MIGRARGLAVIGTAHWSLPYYFTVTPTTLEGLET